MVALHPAWKFAQSAIQAAARQAKRIEAPPQGVESKQVRSAIPNPAPANTTRVPDSTDASHSTGASSSPVIVARAVARRFGDKVAVAGIDLAAGPGITGLLGPNGSGKSTFLREHLEWLLRGRGHGALERALALAARLELPMGKRVRSFSHGMKRQLLVCAALAPEVPVRILDEPTEGLDPTKRGQVLEMLFEDASRGTTILLSSHHLGEVDRACARLVFVQAGRILADETTQAVKSRAARVVRLSFVAGADDARLERAMLDLGGATIAWQRRDGELRASVRVAEEPRDWLARFLSLPGLPAPQAIEHGKLSLAELYRELYGVEGC